MPTTINPASPPNFAWRAARPTKQRKKLDQYLAALDAGLDPVLVTERTRAAQVELAAATAVIDTYKGSEPHLLTGREVHELLEGVGGLTTLLAHSDTAERQRVYRAAGVCLRYHRSEEGEKVIASLRVGLSRVGGPDYAKPEWRIQPWDLRTIG